MNMNKKCQGLPPLKSLSLAVMAMGCATQVHAFNISSGGDWDVNLDTTVQYTAGWRAQGRDSGIANHAFFAEGDYKFDKGDMVTSRLQALSELQGVYQNNTGFRISASAWKDFAYDDKVETNPQPGYDSILTYNGGKYSNETKRYHIQGGELLDAFVFHNTELADKPLYLKAGRFTQYWGNALFFPFSNIAYSQHPVDFLKSFTQPGSEVKELFLPRTQLMASTDLTPELSVSAQYFLEFRPNRFPEGGTYLGPFDILYSGPNNGGAVAGMFGGPVSAGNEHKPKDINDNFGVKVAWSPEWAGGDLGFYYRQFDEVQPWSGGTIYAGGGGEVGLNYADKVRLYGISYERTFGALSTGLELSYRTNTALNSAFSNGQPGVPYREGARGNIVNLIANGLYTLGQNSLWDTGVLLAELSYTHLDKVTENDAYFNGVGYASCTDSLNSALKGGKKDGCATRNAVAVAFLFEPQWLQALPSIDLSMPTSLTYGINGNPAYAAGSFYAEETQIYSIGIKAVYQQKHSVTLQYNGYHWNTSPKGPSGFGNDAYSGFGGNGPVALNDKGWVSLNFKTSF
ncbi:DUF1302 family protein [Pseudomonas sp. 273]|uniref:DUF1302 domain-containing protein n=1 Tax=Pseudomonas sp. 273 TaxID=75692 RepID=UPI0023D84CEE|nr:DUF1302 family protein [Pseudomonas sp. 273]